MRFNYLTCRLVKTSKFASLDFSSIDFPSCEFPSTACSLSTSQKPHHVWLSLEVWTGPGPDSEHSCQRPFPDQQHVAKTTAHSHLWGLRPDPLLSPLVGQKHRGPLWSAAVAGSNPLKTQLESFIRCMVAFLHYIKSYYTTTILLSDSRWGIIICSLPFHTPFQKMLSLTVCRHTALTHGPTRKSAGSREWGEKRWGLDQSLKTTWISCSLPAQRHSRRAHT